MPRALTSLLALSLVVGCQHGGRLMVVVESEGPVFEVEVEAMGRTMASHTFLADAGPDSDPGAPRLPVTPLSFVIVPTDPSNAVDVTVRGYPCDRRTTACQRIERRERARVTPNETRVLRILLSDRCAGVTCAVGVDACTESTCTCGPNGCENVPTWLDLPRIPPGGEFEAGRPDAGAMDAGAMDAPRPDTPELDAPEEPVDAPEEPDASLDVAEESDAPIDASDAPMSLDTPDTSTDVPATCTGVYGRAIGFMLCGGDDDDVCLFQSTLCALDCMTLGGAPPVRCLARSAEDCVGGMDEACGGTQQICACWRAP